MEHLDSWEKANISCMYTQYLYTSKHYADIYKFISGLNLTFIIPGQYNTEIYKTDLSRGKSVVNAVLYAQNTS